MPLSALVKNSGVVVMRVCSSIQGESRGVDQAAASQNPITAVETPPKEKLHCGAN